MEAEEKLDIIILGASGNLAKNKIFPALFALFSQELLPGNISFTGFARSRLTQEEFKEQIMRNLTCRYTPQHSCGDFIEKFLEKCCYRYGQYDEPESLRNAAEGFRKDSNRIFYMALPPVIFPVVTDSISKAGLVNNGKGWVRVVIEKPFGRDRESSDELNEQLLKVFSEEQIYRIDHYLGKEVVQNLFVMRFANQIFKPLWNKDYIQCVRVEWQENIGTEGRGGYFDNYGIIRDVIQNHLLQLVTLVAMKEPCSLKAEFIRDNKLAALHDTARVKLENMTLGQYSGYTDEPQVPADSITPTFANIRLMVDNDEWRDVPFIIRAGKGLARRKSEIRIIFRKPESNIFCSLDECPPANELIIRIQPDEGVHFNIVSKVPGLKMRFQKKELDLSYKSAFADVVIPEAYESLLLDVIHGEKSLFIRNDELEAAWDIFTPVLHRLERDQVKPEIYDFGSDGPDEPCQMECSECVNRK